MKKILVLLLCGFILIGCAGHKEKENVKVDEPKDNEVSFIGVGDNLIHDTIYKQALQEDGSYDFKPMYENVQKDIKKADIAFINQETILGGTELGLSGYPTFNSPTEIAQNLNDTGFNLVNLASNHCLDKWEDGIHNALEAFSKQEGIVVNGIYEDEKSYNTIPVFEKKGIKFSFLTYTYGTNGVIPPYSYSVSYFDDDKIRKDVAEAKKISDVVIVSAHWGDENTFAPNEYQLHYAKLFADLEVDVVIGTHPHTIQAIEWVKGVNGNETLVVYSLGNFIGGMLTCDNAISGMVEFKFVKDENSGEISVKDVKWTPLFIHFEGNQSNILAERYNYKVYKVSQYTDELANKHVLNGFEGNVVSLDYIKKKTEEVINKDYLK